MNTIVKNATRILNTLSLAVKNRIVLPVKAKRYPNSCPHADSFPRAVAGRQYPNPPGRPPAAAVPPPAAPAAVTDP